MLGRALMRTVPRARVHIGQGRARPVERVFGRCERWGLVATAQRPLSGSSFGGDELRLGGFAARRAAQAAAAGKEKTATDRIMDRFSESMREQSAEKEMALLRKQGERYEAEEEGELEHEYEGMDEQNMSEQERNDHVIALAMASALEPHPERSREAREAHQRWYVQAKFAHMRMRWRQQWQKITGMPWEIILMPRRFREIWSEATESDLDQMMGEWPEAVADPDGDELVDLVEKAMMTLMVSRGVPMFDESCTPAQHEGTLKELKQFLQKEKRAKRNAMAAGGDEEGEYEFGVLNVGMHMVPDGIPYVARAVKMIQEAGWAPVVVHTAGHGFEEELQKEEKPLYTGEDCLDLCEQMFDESKLVAQLLRKHEIVTRPIPSGWWNPNTRENVAKFSNIPHVDASAFSQAITGKRVPILAYKADDIVGGFYFI